MKKLMKFGLVSLAALALVACSTKAKEDKTEQSTIAASKVSINVTGYEFGPSVNKIIVQLDKPIKTVDASKAKIETAKSDRTIEKAYVSDADGNALSDGTEGQYVTLELAVTFDAQKVTAPGTPFTYSLETFQNTWSVDYPVKISGLTLTSGETDYTLETEADAIANRVSADLAAFTNRGSRTGTYTNDFTGQDEEVTLQYAAYEPDSLAGGSANPLVIWLHGQGEGGTDTDITLLGNEVVALARPEIQGHFTSEDQTGAYVLAVQTKTYWMDEGDGTNGAGSGVSRYTQALMDTIDEYVTNHPDVDTSRIYLTGGSNGGYMTLNMAVNYPDYFAALVPQAAAYSYYNYERDDNGAYTLVDSDKSLSGKAMVRTEDVYFTDEKLEALTNQPIWFLHAANDTVVDPTTYALPVYKALVDSGASNKWFSYYESVEGSDLPGTSYMGHWSWTYFFNNKMSGVQDPAKIIEAEGITGFEPSNASNGGTATAEVDGVTYTNVFDWLNAQTK
ncbi:prolyl oligopeptidase family serine peptidase [Streptococcus caprae]|uniref:Prolyl oligopeptidase family serine peptidase n=1 Tax=Streptococcus caprae TaxID=1640501 RepID=A0ABV8CTL0_9STRE